jgi:hypothetical protein
LTAKTARSAETAAAAGGAESPASAVSETPRELDTDADPDTTQGETPGEEDQEDAPWQRYLTPIDHEEPTPQQPPNAVLLPADEDTDTALDFLPLLEPRYTARVIQSAASSDAGDGELNIDAAVELLAARRPIDEWPCLPRLSLLRGVQLLVDTGESMALFDRDCQYLADAFRTTVGKHLVKELNFSGSPWQGAGAGPIWTWARYTPPGPGTPVVALSDLNIPRRDDCDVDVDGWLALQELLASRGSVLVVFVPLPASRWPARLRQRLTIVQWDRGTSPSAVRRAIWAAT